MFTIIGVIYMLGKAIKENNISNVQKLIAEGANVNEVCKDEGSTDEIFCEYTPLGLAIQNTSVEMAKLLIDSGANINAPFVMTESLLPITEVSALGLAIKNGDEDMVKLLLESGADVNQDFFDGNQKYSPLDYAMSSSKVSNTFVEGFGLTNNAYSIQTNKGIIKLLAKYGASVSAAN